MRPQTPRPPASPRAPNLDPLIPTLIPLPNPAPRPFDTHHKLLYNLRNPDNLPKLHNLYNPLRTALQAANMDDIQLLATILQGEAAVLGPAGMTAVAAVFIARLLSPAFPSTVTHVAPAFFGRAQPRPDALAIAADALTHPAAFLHHHIEHYGGPYFYCMSAQDRARHNLRKAKFKITRSTVYQLNLYEEDPLGHHNALPAAPVSRPLHDPVLAPHQDTRIR